MRDEEGKVPRDHMIEAATSEEAECVVIMKEDGSVHLWHTLETTEELQTIVDNLTEVQKHLGTVINKASRPLH